MQKLKPAFALLANAIPLVVILLLSYNYLVQSFTYKDDYGTERSHLTRWLLIFLVPLAVDIVFYFISRNQLTNPPIYSKAFAKRDRNAVIALLLSAVLTVVVPWLAAAILSPAPTLGSSFWGILGVGAALNALASAGSVYLFTPLAR